MVFRKIKRFIRNFFGGKRGREEDDDDVDMTNSNDRHTRQRELAALPSKPIFRVNRDLSGIELYDDYTRALQQFQYEIEDYDRRLQVYLRDMSSRFHDNTHRNITTFQHVYDSLMNTLRMDYTMYEGEKNDLIRNPEVRRALSARRFGDSRFGKKKNNKRRSKKNNKKKT